MARDQRVTVESLKVIFLIFIVFAHSTRHSLRNAGDKGRFNSNSEIYQKVEYDAEFESDMFIVEIFDSLTRSNKKVI